ncbi:2'-5' RNA ligase family protein [Mucilaginibacter sp. RB4R14]|uniref:2'-5' RNA ligase family protein n=1 Tax=Mucilaginibacter aurantiaciroseus TaxID=2949308 RepID=UPI0020915BE5|nr:2'-5' RNA ligase family protein [Mucilaginibacter aurantiaciroseus]MCO5935007.1 2'-5' RNA ligase family protein [Mucilaginibacter aurantiaciroseus]
MDTINPLLLTLNITPEAHLFFNKLRKQYFPPERNFLDAHLMLFHQLPANEKKIFEDINAGVREYKNMTLRVTALSSIGNGVAYKIVSDELQVFYKKLQIQWAELLIPQDKNKFWPHITIQNKVSPEKAKQLLQELSFDFKPFEIKATGLSLWEYQGGPWKFIESFDFTG